MFIGDLAYVGIACSHHYFNMVTYRIIYICWGEKIKCYMDPD